MRNFTLTFLLAFTNSLLFGQNKILVLSKNDKVIHHYFKGSYITFQSQGGQWMHGLISSINDSSFDFTKEVIKVSLMRSDTFYFSGYHYLLSDIRAVPRKGVQVHYVNDDHYEIDRSNGHLHWYWIKNGWLLQIGALGYAALHVLNSVIKNDHAVSGKNLAIAAGIFSAGEILHLAYKPVIKLGKKYELKVLQ